MLRVLVGALASVSPLAAQTATPNWILVEDVRIGSIDGPQSLSAFSSLAVSEDGSTVYVPQRLGNGIKVFDVTSGNYVRSIGRSGEGPGEFRYLSRVGWRADTLYATDFVLGRISLFSSTGEHFRTKQVDTPLQPEIRRGSYPIGVTADGNIVSESRLPSAMVADGRITTSPFGLLRPDGSIVRALGLRDLRNTTGIARTGTRIFYFAQPMSRRNYLALHPKGTSITFVSQPAGDDAGGEFQVIRMQPDGSEIFSRSYQYSPRPVARSVADSLYRGLARDLANAMEPARAREVAREYMTIPSFYPPVSSVVASRDGSTWLRIEGLRGDLAQWLVLDSQGEIRAYVAAPRELQILYADEGTVWGVVYDNLDVAYLVRARIRQ